MIDRSDRLFRTFVRRTGGAVLPMIQQRKMGRSGCSGRRFDDAVLNRLATLRGATTARASASPFSPHATCFPNGSPLGQLRHRRAKRSAWDVYLTAAAAVGLLDDDSRSDSAATMTTGFAAPSWSAARRYLTGVLGLKISGRGQGRPGKSPDFHVVTPNGELTAEVKPHMRNRPGTQRGQAMRVTWWRPLSTRRIGNSALMGRTCSSSHRR